LPIGEKSGFIVLDVDKGGDEELAKHTIPVTAESTTGNGRHLYFTYPGEEVKNRQKFLPGLDLRADGGYIVAPPSLHLSGENYTWKSGQIPTKDDFVPCPDRVLEKASESKDYGKGYDAENEDLYDQFCSIAINSSDLVKKEDITPPETIISPWLTDGSLNEIYAPRGVGKTFLGLIISIVVTREKYWNLEIGPWKVDRPSGVLYVDGEMGIYNIKDRVNRLTLPLKRSGNTENKDHPLTIFPSNYFGLHYREYVNINQKKWRDVIYRYLQEKGKYQLLVLDNLSSLTSDLDENSTKDWGPINQWLLSMRSLGVAVIFVHHAGKNKEQRGASAREDNLDCVIKLTNAPGKEENQAHFNITFKKSRNVGPGADLKSFTLKVEDCPFGPGSVWTTEKMKSTKVDKIKAMLLGGDLTQKEIAQRVGRSGGRITQIKNDLKDDGLLDENNIPTIEGKTFREKVDLTEDLDDETD
jgi:putative DNA primase/helicase